MNANKEMIWGRELLYQIRRDKSGIWVDSTFWRMKNENLFFWFLLKDLQKFVSRNKFFDY